VEHGVSGFLSDEPEELNRYARLLMRDKDLAGRMGAAARQVAHERFSIKRFVSRFKRSIEIARAKWETRKITDSYFFPETSGENEKVLILVRSGRFVHLGETFREHVVSGEIEQVVAILDKVMKLLDLPRNISISSLDELINLIGEVSDRLTALHDYNSAGLFAKTALIFSELRNKNHNKRNNPSDNFQQAVLKHP
jgi:hypothetical protein